MNLQEFKIDYYLFNPADYGRIYVFVDFSNVRYWAKSFWPDDNKVYLKRDVDIKKIADICNCTNPEKKFFYYGHYKEHLYLPPEHLLNLKYRQSIYRIDKAKKSGFSIRTKEVMEFDDFDDDGKFLGSRKKCNFDSEITMDMILKIEKYDTAFLWSGDSDFCFLLNHLKSKKKKVITICARRFASYELCNVSDLFIPADPLKNLLEYIPIIKSTPGFRREA